MRNDHPALRRRCTRSAVFGERNAATARPDNPQPTTAHSPSPQLVKVPSARTGDRLTSPQPVTPTRPARRLNGRPSARTRARGGRLRARPPALGPRGPRCPTTPPPIRLLLAGRRAVHRQPARPRQRPRQPSTALHTLVTHTQTQYRNAPHQRVIAARRYLCSTASGKARAKLSAPTKELFCTESTSLAAVTSWHSCGRSPFTHASQYGCSAAPPG